MTLEEYLAALASAAPTPGGGSAATIVAALGASLVAMVARITRANPAGDTALAARADAVIRAADMLRDELIAARLADEAAYAGVVAAQALPRGTPAEKTARTEALQRALAGAAEAPLHAAALAVRVLHLADDAASLENVHLESDVACARAFASAAVTASAANVRTNHTYLRDAALVAAQASALAALERDAKECTHA